MSLKLLLKYLPHLAILASLLVYAYLLFIGNYDYALKGSGILLPLILVSVFLIVKNKSLSCSDASFPCHKISCSTLGKIYFIIFFAAVTWMLMGNRGIVHLILIFMLYCVTLSQLFSKNPTSKLIILEIILTTAILIIPKLFWPAYFYADMDLATHLSWTSIITETGYVTGAFGAYEFYCLYHILTAATHAVTSMTANWSLYLISTVAVLGSVPFVYLMAQYFTKSNRISLLSTFLYALLPMILHALSVPAPRVMATMAFFIITYLLFALFKRCSVQTTILVGIVALYMSLVHHAQLLFILAICAGLIFGAIIFYRKGLLRRTGAVILSLGFVCLSLCIGYGNSLISIVNNRFFKQVENFDLTGSFKPVETIKPIEPGTTGVSVPDTPQSTPTDVPSVINPPIPTSPSTEIIDVADEVINAGSSGLFEVSYYGLFTTGLASAIMIILIFAGLYALIMRLEHPKKISVILPLVLLTFVFFIQGVMDIFPIMTGSFQIYRFRYLLTIFFAIIMGVGCMVFINSTSKKNRSQKVGTILTVLLCVGMIITCPILGYSKDNEVFYQYDFLPQSEQYFDEGDMAAFTFTENYVTDTVYSDREHAGYVSRWIPHVGGSNRLLKMFTVENSASDKVGVILYPYAQAERADIRFWSGTSTTEPVFEYVGEYPSEIFDENIFRYNKIYLDNSDIYYIFSDF